MLHYKTPTNRDAMGQFLSTLYLTIPSFGTGCGPVGYKSSPESYTHACSGLQPKATVARAPISYVKERQHLSLGLRGAMAHGASTQADN